MLFEYDALFTDRVVDDFLVVCSLQLLRTNNLTSETKNLPFLINSRKIIFSLLRVSSCNYDTRENVHTSPGGRVCRAENEAGIESAH